MNRFRKIVYVRPPFEEVQHNVTVFSSDEEHTPLESSFHSDVSLLMRIDKLQADATLLDSLKDQLQPLVDLANKPVETVESVFGSVTDEEKINACPSRYLSTTSERLEYFKHLSESRDKLLEIEKKNREAHEKAVKDEEESKAFREKMSAYFNS